MGYLLIKCSRGASSRSRPHQQCIGYQNFDKVRIEFRLGQNQQCHDTCLGFECESEKERVVKMRGSSKLHKLVICSGQFFTSKNHNIVITTSKIKLPKMLQTS